MDEAYMVEIEGHKIGRGHPVFVVAEIGGNHGGSIDLARELVSTAKMVGADAVKFQCFKPEDMTWPDDPYRIPDGIWKGRSLYELYQETYTPWEWLPGLFDYARSLGLVPFASAFSDGAIGFLDNACKTPCHKLASFEITDLRLLASMAMTGKPIIISTGVGFSNEIRDAMLTVEKSGNAIPIVLHCVSQYPASIDVIHLDNMAQLPGIHGLSDHTLSVVVPALAVAKGACYVEKHLRLDSYKCLTTPDTAFSLGPWEFQLMVDNVRLAELVQVEGVREIPPASRRMVRCLWLVADKAKGERFVESDFKSLRCGGGNGLLPRFFYDVLRMKSTRNLRAGMPLTWEMVEWL